MSNNKLKNPFTQEHWFSQIVKSDKNIQFLMKQNYNKFINQHGNENLFMTLKNTYLQIVYSITKHAFLATLVMLFALGGVGASAAQLLAPEAYKPSTLIQKTFNPKDFEANKQKDKNPFTALKPDENNDVVLLEKCNLAIKYPKRYENKFNTVVYRGDYNEGQLDYAYIFPKEGELVSGDKYFGPSIDCSLNKPESLDLIEPMYGEVDPSLKNRAKIGKEIPNITAEFIKKNMGWFITEAELSPIQLYDNPNIPGDYTLYFEYKDIHYLIEFQLNDLKTTEGDSDGNIPVIKASQIQLQFLSLAESEANAQVLDKSTGNTVPLDGSTVTQDLYFVGSINTGKGDFIFNTILEDANKTRYLIPDFDNSKFEGDSQCLGVTVAIYTLTGTYKKERRVTEFMEGDKITSDYTISNVKNPKLICVAGPTESFSSNSSDSLPINLILNEEFVVQGGGQMRYNQDTNGGIELKRTSDGMVFVMMNSVFNSTDKSLNFGQKVLVTGNYIEITKDVGFAGGSGNAKFIITKLDKIQ